MKSKYLVLSLALGFLLSAGLLVALSAQSSVVTAQAASTAYILVRFDADTTVVRQIVFTEPISAYRALELSGLAFTTSDTGFGPFLCSIEEVGDTSPVCDNGDRYWATYAWNASTGGWEERAVGIAEAMITEDGHVEGFSWSDPGWIAIEPPAAPPLVAASVPAPSAEPASGAAQSPTRVAGYIAFGVIVVALVVGLVWRFLRKP